MAHDDDPDDPSGFGPPLPPEDRLWRHPSEVGAAGPPRDDGPPRAASLPPDDEPAHARSWATAAVAAVAGVAGAALAVGVIAATGSLGDDIVERTVVEKVALPPLTSTPASLPVDGSGSTPVADVTGPAVVALEVAEDGRRSTGVVFRDDGHVLTTAGFLDGTDDVTVVLGDGRRLDGVVVGIDSVTDVGVVRVADDELPVAVLGTAEGLSVGQPTVALARPSAPGTGLESVAGEVEGVDGRADRDDGPTLHGLIETDVLLSADIGGALVDGRGALVGLVAVGGSGRRTLAMPIDVVHGVALEILESGRARHVWLGVEGSDADGGAHLRAVVGDSPAHAAGLAADDVIVAVDGEPVSSMSDLVVVLRDHDPGDEVEVDYVRDGRPGVCEVELGERQLPS